MKQKLWRQREEGKPRRLQRATWETQSASRLEIHLNISGPAVDKKKKRETVCCCRESGGS